MLFRDGDWLKSEIDVTVLDADWPKRECTVAIPRTFLFSRDVTKIGPAKVLDLY